MRGAMHLFDGLAGTDYQDILRAVGQVIDGKGLRHIRIMEVEEGLLVQGLPAPDSMGVLPEMETIVMPHADLQRILHAAYRRRRRDAEPPAPATPAVRPVTVGLLARDRRRRTSPEAGKE